MLHINGNTVAANMNNLQPTDFSKVTAHPEFVLKGKTFYDETGQLREGTAALAAKNLITKTITENGTYNATDDGVDGYSTVEVNVAGIEDISTSDEMTALLVEANVGKVYRFTGTTDETYTNGDLYEVTYDTVEFVYKFRHYTEAKPQLSTPMNVSADGTTVSWDEVENATSYEILADGTSIGEVSN